MLDSRSSRIYNLSEQCFSQGLQQDLQLGRPNSNPREASGSLSSGAGLWLYGFGLEGLAFTNSFRLQDCGLRAWNRLPKP